MDSQSGRSLPVIYRPIDLTNRGDWSDEGQILDFICATDLEGKRVLDFGPGDGWPSLRIADEAEEVVGVDASPRRVEECRSNAERLGSENIEYLQVPVGDPLPFDSEHFDAVVAASSVEQTPDPVATIREFVRVLKPGGRLRMTYEDLDRYRNRLEFEGGVESCGPDCARIEMMVREADREVATMVRIDLRGPAEDFRALLQANDEGEVDLATVGADRFGNIERSVQTIEACRLRHLNGESYLRELTTAGFSDAKGTFDGGRIAARLFTSKRRQVAVHTHAELREYLYPIVETVVGFEAPIGLNPWITATK